MRWARHAVVVTTAAFIALVCGLVAPAAAGKFGDVVAATTSPGSTISPTGHYYLLDAKPGDSVTQSIRVSNPNDHPVTVMVDAVDATTGALTGVQLSRPGSARALTSRWIVVSSPQITLAPNEGRDVPFTVHVPLNATPGQYLAGVSASVPLTADDTKSNQPPPGKAGFSMSVSFQRGIAVEIDVPGPRAPSLSVTGADPQATPDGVVLGVHIANGGNAFAHGTGVVRVADTNTDFSFRIDTFVDHTAIVYPMPWTKVVVPGSHHVEVDLSYEGGRRTSWSGSVLIAGDTQNKLESALQNVTIRRPGSNDNLLYILGAALFVVLLAAAIMMRRRRRGPGPVNYRTM
jgi:hypothetical protein